MAPSQYALAVGDGVGRKLFRRLLTDEYNIVENVIECFPWADFDRHVQEAALQLVSSSGSVAGCSVHCMRAKCRTSLLVVQIKPGESSSAVVAILHSLWLTCYTVMHFAAGSAGANAGGHGSFQQRATAGAAGAPVGACRQHACPPPGLPAAGPPAGKAACGVLTSQYL